MVGAVAILGAIIAVCTAVCKPTNTTDDDVFGAVQPYASVGGGNAVVSDFAVVARTLQSSGRPTGKPAVKVESVYAEVDEGNEEMNEAAYEEIDQTGSTSATYANTGTVVTDVGGMYETAFANNPEYERIAQTGIGSGHGQNGGGRGAVTKVTLAGLGGGGSDSDSDELDM